MFESKLTPAQRNRIDALYYLGRVVIAKPMPDDVRRLRTYLGNMRTLAVMFNVSPATVSNIINGKARRRKDKDGNCEHNVAIWLAHESAELFGIPLERMG